jgi:hypothetical protein
LISVTGDPEGTVSLSLQALDQLIESRQRFPSFVQGRVSSSEAAEDIRQSAFVARGNDCRFAID